MKSVFGREYARRDGTAMFGVLVIALVMLTGVAAVISYVIHTFTLARHRQEMVNGYQYAQGGAAVAARDVEMAFTNGTGTLSDNLTDTAGPAPYKRKNKKKFAGEEWRLYERDVTEAFSNQPVSVQLYLPDDSKVAFPHKAKIFASTEVNGTKQTVQTHLQMTFRSMAAIISTHRGTTATSASKGNAQAGNAVVLGNKNGVTSIYGGIEANGEISTNDCYVDWIRPRNYGTENAIPDYTDPGATEQLFDFGRFKALGVKMGTYYTNLAQFVAAAADGTVLEGVIVVDVQKTGNPNLDPTTLPKGINVRGTLVFLFDSSWTPSDKLVNTAAMNINAANVTGLNPLVPSTFTTGYPPTFSKPSKNPYRTDIAPKYPNLTDDEDLPALMYNNVILDMHGPVNICGAVYSPGFMEIENKQDDQLQYFNGALIGGGGIYVENLKSATTVVAKDESAIDALATAYNRGLAVKVVFQE